MTKVWMVMLLGITIGCGSGTPSHPDTGPAVVTERRVDPGTTGAGITNSTGQHFIVAPASSNRTGILLVFLPGREDGPTSIRELPVTLPSVGITPSGSRTRMRRR